MNYQLKKGYKLTEVGVIPEAWEVKIIGDIADVKTGPFGSTLHERDYVADGTPIITVEHLGELGVEHLNLPMVSDFDRTRLRAYSLKTGDLVFSRVGSIDRNALIQESENGWLFSGRLLRVRVRKTGIKPNYLTYHFHSEPFKRRVREIAVGQTMPSLNTQLLKSVVAIVPTESEQRSIASALSDMDALLVGLDRLIAKKRDLKQAAMQQLLTGKTRLPGFGEGKGYKETEIGEIPEDWDGKPLKVVSTMSGRIGWQGLKQEEFTTNDTDPFLITGMNFKEGKIRWDEVYHISESRYQEDKNIQLKDGDILMTKDGTIGKILYVEDIPSPGKASLNSHLLVFRPVNGAYNPKFLFYQLSSKQFTDYVDLNKSGSTFFGITQEAVGNYKAYLPSLHEQNAISTVLSDMDAEIAALEQRRDKTRALKQGMMQELLTGRTRLV